MTLPRIVILEALLAHFRDVVDALPAEQQFKVRHWRHRNPSTNEMPCVSLRFEGDDPQGTVRATDGEQPSIAEEVFELTVDLVADAPLPAENDDTPLDDGGEDPTGLGVPAAMLEILLNSLWTPGELATTLGGVAFDIRYDGSGDDGGDSKPDNARLADRITIEYRVRAEAPTHLLMGE